MKLVNLFLVACCILLVKSREGSSIKLGIFGGGLLVGLGRAILNTTRPNTDTPVLVRSTAADEPEVASDYLEDYNSGTRFEYNYDFDPIDLNYSYDYDTAVDDGQPQTNGSESNAGISDVASNPVEVSLGDQAIPDFSDAPGGLEPSLVGLTQPDYDYDVGVDDTVRRDDTAIATSDSFTVRPATAEQDVDANNRLNLTVPDYSSNPVPDVSENSPIDLQEIFSGIISLTTEEPQPIYESVISNVVFPHSEIENPEYVPDLEGEDTFNPKYGLGNTEGSSVTSPTTQTPQVRTTSTVVPTSTTTTTTTTTSATPPTPHEQQINVPLVRAKLIARYSFDTLFANQPIAHSVILRGKSLRASVSKSSMDVRSNSDSRPAALRRQASGHLFRGNSPRNVASSADVNAKIPLALLGSQRQVSSRPHSSVHREITVPKSSISPSRTNLRGIVRHRSAPRSSVSSRAARQKLTDGPSNGPQVRTVEYEPGTPAIPHKIQQTSSHSPQIDTLRKSSRSESKSSVAYQRGKRLPVGNLANIRSKRTVTERKVQKSKKLVDGYLPRGVGIDLRHRDRWQGENGSKSALKNGNAKSKNSAPYSSL